MRPRGIVLISILLGAFIGVIVGLRGPRVEQSLKDYIRYVAKNRLQLEVSIESLELELFPPSVALEGLQIKSLGSNELSLSVHQVRGVFRAWPSATGALVVSALELDRPIWQQRFQSFEKTKNALRPDAVNLPIDILHIDVLHGQAQFLFSDRSIFFDDFEFLQRETSEQERTSRFSTEYAHIDIAGNTHSLEAKGQLTLKGSLDNAQHLSLDRLHLFLPKIHLEMSGAIPLAKVANDAPMPMYELITKGRLNLKHLQSYIPGSPNLAGEMQTQATLRGPRDFSIQPRLELHSKMIGLVVDDIYLGKLTSHLLVEKALLTIEAFALEDEQLGKVTGSGSFDRHTRKLNLHTKLVRASLPRLFEFIEVKNSWVRMRLSGENQISGTLHPLHLKGHLKVKGENLQSLDGPYSNPKSRIFLTVPDLRIEGDYEVKPGKVDLHSMALARNDTLIWLAGVAYDRESKGMDLDLNSPYFNIEDLGPITSVVYTGAGPTKARIHGPYRDIEILATPDFENFGFSGFVFGKSQTVMTYRQKRLYFDEVVTTRKLGSLTGSGWIDYSSSPLLSYADIDINGVEASELLQSARAMPSFSERISGIVSGHASFAGPLLAPVGSIDLVSTDILMDRVSFGPSSLRIDLGYGDGSTTQMSFSAQPQKGRLNTLISISPPTEQNDKPIYGISVFSDKLSLSLIDPLLGGLGFDGQMSGLITLGGRAGELGGEVELVFNNLAVGQVMFGHTKTEGKAKQGKLSFKGTSLAGRGQMKGDMTLSQGLPFNYELVWQGVASDDVLKTRQDAVLVSDATIFSQGQLMDPKSISSSIKIHRARLKSGNLNFKLESEALLTFANNRLSLLDFVFRGKSFQGSLSGDVWHAGDTAMRLRGQGEIGFLSLFLPNLDNAKGQLHLDLQLDGEATHPSVYGSAKIRKGSLALDWLATDVEDAGFDVMFLGRSLEIQKGRGTFGSGALRFWGELFMPTKDDVSRMEFRSILDDAEFKVMPGMTMRASGAFDLEGPIKDLLLRGNIEISKLEYWKNLELKIENFLPKKGKTLTVPKFVSSQTISVDVHAEAKDSILFQSDQLEALFSASVDFRGSTDSLGMVGTLTPTRGQVEYRDLVFRLDRGDITFTEEYRIFGRFDLAASAEGCGMKLKLGLSGNTEGSYSLELSGEDDDGPVHEQDPWSCLSFGMRLSEYARRNELTGSAAGNAPTLDALGSGLDILWGVSGLDARVRKILPVVDQARITLGRSGRYGKSRRTAPRLVVRKDVGDRLQLEYNGALDEPDDHILSLEYALSKIATLQGNWVSISDVPVGDFGLDLRLKWEFD
jgi:translocation and assembly module TamB